MSEGYKPKGTGKKPAAPPKAPSLDESSMGEFPVINRYDSVYAIAIRKDEAARVLSWFGQAASVSPEDFELAGRIRRAFE